MSSTVRPDPTSPGSVAPAPVVPTSQRGIHDAGVDLGWMANLAGRRIEFGNHETTVIVRVIFDAHDTFSEALVDDGKTLPWRLHSAADLISHLAEHQPRV